VGTATHYHADYVHPWWAPTVAKIDQIGAHIFYRWKGVSGETAAFRQAYSGREPLIDEARFSRPPLLAAVDVGATADPESVEAIARANGVEMRTVQIDGQTRVVGAASLGGRRLPTREEIAEINARLDTFQAQPPHVAPTASPPGVTAMAVEEVGKPQG